MKKKNIILLALLLLAACKGAIKNSQDKVEVENGTEATEGDGTVETFVAIQGKSNPPSPTDAFLGFWVGYFSPDRDISEDFKTVNADEGFWWGRENKINLSIDQIKDTLVIGHSVVAGNDRPFKGSVKKGDDGIYRFEVREPGDDKYDGAFSFQISGATLTGKWKAYGKIEIKNRVYELAKKEFAYNPDIALAYSKDYVEWGKIKKTTHTEKFDDKTVKWISEQFATATNSIYEINASNKLLTKEQVENLKKGDLTIIRNSIYARHGYSFKSRPLRVFFDAQEWYVPVHTNIKSDFTEIEKKNIELLLRYEKNAKEYYDSFGRG